MIIGNTTSPKAVVVLNAPEAADLAGDSLEGPRGSILRQAINLEDYAVAFLVPEQLSADPVTGEGSRKPNEFEIEKHLPELLVKLSKYDVPIIPLGATLLKCFLGPDVILMKSIGKKFKPVFNGKTFEVIPNFDPGMIHRKPQLLGEFQAVFTKAFEAPKGVQWAILSYEDAIIKLKQVLKLYKAGLIDYTIFDTETTSFDPHTGQLIMYSWAHEADEKGYCIPLKLNNNIPALPAFADFKLIKREEQGTVSNENWDASNPYNIPEVHIVVDAQQIAAINMLVRQILETVPVVGHNLKFDIKYLHYHNVADLRKMHIQNDTYIMGFQIYGQGFSGWLSLKGMAARYCGAEEWDAPVEEYLSRYRKTADRNYGNIPTGMLGYYACLDAYWNRELYRYLKRVIPDSMLYVTRLVTDMIRPFSEAEVKGVKVDMEMKAYLEEQYSKLETETHDQIMKLPKVSVFRQLEFQKLYDKKAAELKKGKPNPEKIWPEVLKLKSTEKIKTLMYDSKYYNLPVLEDFMTDGGKKGVPQPETGKGVRVHFIENFLNDETIDSLRADLPDYEIETLLEARQFLHLLNENSRMQKLLSTYLGENLMEQCEGTLLKPNFALCGTFSGRMSSGFHVTDSWSDIKRLYTSRWRGKGGIFLAPDFSQLELRIAGCVSGDPSLIQAYRDNIDIHIMTASKLFKVAIEEVNKAYRAKGKIVNFSILYGKTEHGLAQDLGVSKEEARKMIEAFFDGFYKLKEYFEAATNMILSKGYIETKFGRRVPIENWDSKNKWKLEAAIRSGNNATIQSAASDCVLWTIRETYAELVVAQAKSVMVASVHDSVEYDCYPGELFLVLNSIRHNAEVKLAETLDWISCPMALGFEMGVQWGSSVEFEIGELSKEHLIGHGKGLRRDVLALMAELELAYDVKYIVKEEDDKKYSSKDIAYVVRDDKIWDIELEIRAKNSSIAAA